MSGKPQRKPGGGGRGGKGPGKAQDSLPNRSKGSDSNNSSSAPDVIRKGPSTALSNEAPPAKTKPSLSMNASKDPPATGQDSVGYKTLDKRADFEGLPYTHVNGNAIRPGFTNSKSEFKVLANYLSLDLIEPANGPELFIYEVNGIDDSMTKPKKRVLMETFIQQSKILYEQKDVIFSDYNKTIIGLKDLSKHDGQGSVQKGQDLVEIGIDNFNARTQDKTKITLRLRLSKILKYKDLLNFCAGGSPEFSDPELVRAINLMISLSIAAIARNSVVQGRPKEAIVIGTNKVYSKNGYVKLNEHDRKLAFYGYSFGFQAGMGQALLNVNPITTLFHEPMKVSQYIKAGTTDGTSVQLRKDLIGVRVWLDLDRIPAPGKGKGEQITKEMNNPERRLKTIRGFSWSIASKQIAYGQTSVWEHFENTYPKKSKGQPGSVCVNLGGDQKAGKEQWFLAEDLIILPYQPFKGDSSHLAADIVKKACRTPDVNRELIVADFMPFLNLDNAVLTPFTLKKPGVVVGSQLLCVNAHRAAPPSIRYQKGQPPKLNHGQWTLVKEQFLTNTVLFSSPTYFLIDGSVKSSDKDIELYLKHFVTYASTNGVQGLKFRGFNDESVIKVSNNDDMVKAMKKAQQCKAGLVVLILPRKDKENLQKYAAFKTAADQTMGMKSLCLCDEKIRTMASKNRQDPVPLVIPEIHPFVGYTKNVAMKLNVRLGNSNHSVAQAQLEENIPGFRQDKLVMILGADVVHKSRGAAEGTPSIAAVVGTTGSDFAVYRGSARRQYTELIPPESMKAMVQERLRAFQRANGDRLPSRILYYRDGIDEGQFKGVREEETEAIREAWNALLKTAKNPPKAVQVTTVIVSKRHHTRFYPMPQNKNHQTKIGNCLPGTVVDNGVTMPYNFDFFLISHNAIKGTARPAHYIVLQDEINFKPDQLQELTNLLCSTYARSTTAVSYVPAAYYADHLCERVKQYFRVIYDGSVQPTDGHPDLVQEQFERIWNQGGRGMDGNPWNEALDGTMFWL